MTRSRLGRMTILLVLLALALSACAQRVTPQVDPNAVSQVEEAAPEEAEAEETEAAEEATGEEAAEAEETEAAEETEGEEVADAEAEGEETTAETEATEEAEAEEATAETEATEEAEGEAEAVEVTEAAALATYTEGDYSFDYPDNWELNESVNGDTITLALDDQEIVIFGPQSYSTVLGRTQFESDAEELAFFLQRSGYTLGEETEMEMGLASYALEIPRREMVGSATLLDVNFDRRLVIVELGMDAESIPAEAGATIASSIVYPGNLLDIAANAENFTTLVAALEAANLDDDVRDGELTVFAPTDEAFAALLEALGVTAEDLLADTELLTTVLTYHVVEGVVMAETVVTLDGESVATLNGESLTVGVSDEGVTLTDVGGNVVNVIETDIEASNGVIHVIDAVLLPTLPSEEEAEATEAPAEAEATDEPAEEPTQAPDADTASLPNIVSLAVGNGDLSTLATAVVSAGLVDALSADGPITVFAPTNAAFAAALSELGISFSDLAGDTELLTSVLTYHVVEGAVFSGDLVEGDVETLNGETITISFGDDGSVMVNGATVVIADVEASNGVVHVIDSVLLPPSGE